MKWMVCGFGNPEELAFVPYMEKAGVGIELQSYGLKGALSDEEWNERRVLHRNVRSRYKGPLSIHGPFLGISYNYKDHLLRAAVAKRMDMTFEVVSEFRPQTLVLHTGMTSEVPVFKMESAWLDDLTEYWSCEIRRYADLGVQVVLENIIEETPDLMIELIDRVDHPFLGICFDVGHHHLCGRIGLEEWIERLGSRLKHVHAHDNNGTHDEHLPVGQGRIDFDLLFRILKLKAPQATVSLEVNSTPQKVAENVEYVLQKYSR